ncbi:MAG: hypothetical protein DSZ09_02445 [Sulfurovum sp.]|nr:MAG: hypothetical protein DSZ09_02445 [Sulfurovum sp.]
MKNFYKILLTMGLMTVVGNAVTTTKYTIKNGETLYTIAHKHHTTIEEVRKANKLKKGEILKPGRALTVPLNTYFPNKKSKKTKMVKNGKKTKIVKKNKKTKIVRKNKKLRHPRKMNKSLRMALTKHTTPLKERTKIRNNNRITIDDIFFKVLHPFGMGSSSTKRANIIKLAKTKLGKRYVWGAVGKGGTFDCSGFTNYVYKKNGIRIPRTSFNQSKYGAYVSRNNLQKGDLIFFDTSKRHKGYVNHVGIYLGNGKFIHASSAKKKVVITSLKKKFYSQCYVGARRPS